MKCPFCAEEETKVIDSRPSEDNTAIRRRRQCEGCGKRFTTYEKVETFPLMVVKKDNNREAYDRAKLEGGILVACHKRPVSRMQIEDLINSIESELFAKDVQEIRSNEIGELVMNKLKDIDEVAYVRFASVYREFADVDSFTREVTKLLKKKKDI